jgi:hypothetical protein
MITLLWRVGLINLMIVLDEVRIPLVRLASEKSVEAIEAQPERPALARCAHVELVDRRKDRL